MHLVNSHFLSFRQLSNWHHVGTIHICCGFKNNLKIINYNDLDIFNKSINYIIKTLSFSFLQVLYLNNLNHLHPNQDAHSFYHYEGKSIISFRNHILHKRQSYNEVYQVLLIRYLKAFIQVNLHSRIEILLAINLCQLEFLHHLAILQQHHAPGSK